MNLNYTVLAYLLYLPAALAVTIWVARTLHRNGRIFLVAAFRGNEAMADSVNHLLVVGFYLINVGFVTTSIRLGLKPHDMETMIEFLSTKLGIVLLVLGTMHFFNLFNFDRMRRKGTRADTATPLLTAATPPPRLPTR